MERGAARKGRGDGALVRTCDAHEGPSWRGAVKRKAGEGGGGLEGGGSPAAGPQVKTARTSAGGRQHRLMRRGELVCNTALALLSPACSLAPRVPQLPRAPPSAHTAVTTHNCESPAAFGLSEGVSQPPLAFSLPASLTTLPSALACGCTPHASAQLRRALPSARTISLPPSILVTYASPKPPLESCPSRARSTPPSPLSPPTPSSPRPLLRRLDCRKRGSLDHPRRRPRCRPCPRLRLRRDEARKVLRGDGAMGLRLRVGRLGLGVRKRG
jgi:hypothetical protein